MSLSNKKTEQNLTVINYLSFPLHRTKYITMNSGSANNDAPRQTKLTFAKPAAPHKVQQQQQSGMTSNAEPTTDGSQNKSKRGRIEFEESDNETPVNHLQIPAPRISTESNSSLFDSDSVSTIIDSADKRTPQESHPRNEDDHKPRVIRLERLRDKADRYSSHIGFLKECKETRVIPKGLKIDVEPSIGNNDEEFCSQWFAQLEEFSLALITSIINYSEKIENATANKIDEETAYLRANMRPNDFKECVDQMDLNSTQRRKRLSASKRKKYHHLRYNRPDKQDQRPERQTRPERHISNHRSNDYSDEEYEPQRNNRNRDDVSNRNRNQFGDGRDTRRNTRNEYSSDAPGTSDRRNDDVSNRNQRNNYGNDNGRRNANDEYYTEAPGPSSRRNDDASNRNQRNQYGNDNGRRSANDHHVGGTRQSNRNEENASNRQRINQWNDHYGDDRDSRNRQVRIDSHDPPRRQSYRDILRSRPSHNSLSTRNSNRSLSRKNSRSDRDNHKEHTVSHTIYREPQATITTHESEASKNGQAPTGGATPEMDITRKKTHEEMMNFISETMKNLESFRKQLIN